LAVDDVHSATSDPGRRAGFEAAVLQQLLGKGVPGRERARRNTEEETNDGECELRTIDSHSDRR
jgi:hypothetical protein